MNQNILSKAKEANLSKAEYIREMYKQHEILFQYAEFIKGTDIKEITIKDEQVSMLTRSTDIRLLCKKFDERTVPIEILNFGNYEEEEMQLLDQLLAVLDPKTFFDIGANIGYVSLLFSRKYKETRFYAFEPISYTFEILKKNISLNNRNNITIFNKGLSNEEKDATFYYYPEGSGNASLSNLSQNQTTQEVKCKLTTLDLLIQKEQIHSLDFIKCDVEGAEYFVFLGGQKSIAEYKPVIYTELLRKWSKHFNYTPNDVISFLGKLGYQCFIIEHDSLLKLNAIDDSTPNTNFIFLHTEKHKELITKFHRI